MQDVDPNDLIEPGYFDSPETELRIRLLAAEMIKTALEDLQKPRSPYYEEALRWFNARMTEVFGYGWCLQQTSLNPNTIRREINKRIEKNVSSIK